MEESNVNIRKQRILDAALKVFATKSFDEATVREIASTAGLTTGAIYHHYKNKNELLYDAIKQNIHFIYKLSERDGDKIKAEDIILKEVQDQVRQRMLKLDEQRLHLLLLGDVLSSNEDLKEKYKQSYDEIIEKVANMFYYTFGLNNEKYKKLIASIFVAALDGISIQYSLGVIPEGNKDIIETFNAFFSESIPDFLEKHK